MVTHKYAFLLVRKMHLFGSKRVTLVRFKLHKYVTKANLSAITALLENIK